MTTHNDTHPLSMQRLSEWRRSGWQGEWLRASRRQQIETALKDRILDDQETARIKQSENYHRDNVRSTIAWHLTVG